MTRGRRAAWALMMVALPAAAAPATGQSMPDAEALRAMARHLVEDGEAPGVVLGVLEADGRTRIASWGSAGEGARPLDARSVFEIGSVGKTFTGALLADMVARGEVSLSDPVARWLPDSVGAPTREGRAITLLDLVTHTSGIDDEAVLPILVRNGFRPTDPGNPWGDYTLEALHAWLPEYELPRTPGSAYSYSNLGMGLLGHALSRAAGRPFSELVRERVLEPLGMGSTTWDFGGPLAGRAVVGHSQGAPTPPWTGTEAIRGAGGLRSEVRDMLAWVAANAAPDAAPPGLGPALAASHRARRALDEQGDSIGLAWRRTEVGGRTVLTHGGGTGGFRAMVAFDPDRGVGAVLLANGADLDEQVPVELVAFGTPAGDGRASGAGPSGGRPGEYVADVGPRVYVRDGGEAGLSIQALGEVRRGLRPGGDGIWRTARGGWTVRFDDASPAGPALVLERPGSEPQMYRHVGPATPAPAVVALNAIGPVPAAARYEGTYEIAVGARTLEVRVRSGEERLEASFAGSRPSRLSPLEGHTFLVVANPTIRITFELRDGRAVAATLQQGRRSDSGPRRTDPGGPGGR